jgi:hypothetical protein
MAVYVPLFNPTGPLAGIAERNMKQLIPVIAQQLHEGALPINGVKQGGMWRRRSHWTG